MPIVTRDELIAGAHDAQPLHECRGCKAWMPETAIAAHARKCKRLLMIKDVKNARKGR